MLNRILRDLEQKMHAHAIDSIDRPYTGDIAFEAGRRQGVLQGLKISRQLILDSVKGDEDDVETSSGGKNVRRSV